MNILKKGTDPHELEEALQEISELTKIDSLLKTGDKVLCKVITDSGTELYDQRIYESGKLKQWALYVDEISTDSASSTVYKKRRQAQTMVCDEEGVEVKRIAGLKFDPFISAVKDMAHTEKKIPITDLFILCYRSAELNVTAEGKIITHWFAINPLAPYEEAHGSLNFAYKTLYLSREDFAKMSRTGIGLMHGSTLYSFGTTALPSLGRLIDCASAFNTVGNDNLGICLQIANQLCNMKELQLIYQKAHLGEVNMVMGVAGSRFVKIAQDDLYKKIQNVLASRGLYDIVSWEVTDTQTYIDFKIIDFLSDAKYQKGIIVRTSDLSDQALTLCSYAKVQDSFVFLKENSVTHSKSYEKKGMQMLFDGIWESFEQFEETMTELSEKYIMYNGKYQKDIAVIIGKKRMLEQENIVPGVYNCLDLFNRLICEVTLPLKQMNDLRRMYYAILDDMKCANAYETPISYEEVG